MNSRGLPTSVTMPDPDGSGPLSAPVTFIAYDSYGRAVTITNPDASTQTFTYNTADQQLPQVDELSKTTTSVYDSLGRAAHEGRGFTTGSIPGRAERKASVCGILDRLKHSGDDAFQVVCFGTAQAAWVIRGSSAVFDDLNFATNTSCNSL